MRRAPTSAGLTHANSVLPRGGARALANLAFGSLNLRRSEALTTDGLDPGRHLAFLPTDALELDLSDPNPSVSSATTNCSN